MGVKESYHAGTEKHPLLRETESIFIIMVNEYQNKQAFLSKKAKNEQNPLYPQGIKEYSYYMKYDRN